MLLRCLEKEEALKVLSSLHEGLIGGHFGAEVTTDKILRDGYYWPTLFNNAYAHVINVKNVKSRLVERKGLLFPCNPWR